MLIPAAVGLLIVSNTVPNIKRLLQNNTTSTNATPLPTSDTVVPGSVSVTAISNHTLFVRNARSKANWHLPRKCITSFRYQRVVATRKATLWLFANLVTQGLLLGAEFTITDRVYLGYEDDTGYHHYAMDVAKHYETEG